MGLPRVVLFVCALTCLLSFGESIERDLDTADISSVTLRQPFGEIEIFGWDQENVKITGVIDDIADELVIERIGNSWLVESRYPEDVRSFDEVNTKLKIYLPKQLALTFVGLASSLSVEGLVGEVQIDSVSGNIQVSEIANGLVLNSVSGKIVLQNVFGSLSLATVSGPIEANVVSSDITVSSVSADLVVNSDVVRKVSIQNVSGDTRFSAEYASEANVTLSSVTGAVVLPRVSPLDAQVSLQAGPGGTIVNQWSELKPKQSSIRESRLLVSEGQGSATIKLVTVSGVLRLDQ